MAVKKMDFNEFCGWASNNFSENDMDIGILNRLAVLKFTMLDGKAVSDSRFGKVHKDFYDKTEIQDGEYWLCSLKQSGAKSFKATPIRRVDAGFATELHPDILAELEDAVWNSHREEVSSMLEDKFRGEIDAKASEIAETKVAEAVSEKDVLIEEIKKSQEAGLELINRLRAEITELKARNSDLLEMVSRRKEQPEMAAAAEKPATPNMTAPKSRREGDTLYLGLRDGRYKMTFSANLRTMEIKESSSGMLESKGGAVTVKGLEYILGPAETDYIDAKLINQRTCAVITI